MKKISSVSTALTVLSLSLATTSLGLLVWWQQEQIKNTNIVFLNVGQGDAILIQQGRHQILIDSGRESAQLASELGRYVPFWDRHIEMIIPTHTDADHIGGFAGLTKHYSVGRILWTGVEGTTDVYTEFHSVYSEAVPSERWQKMAAGSRIALPRGGSLEALYPYEVATGPAPDEDTNATSIVLRFEYGDTSFLLTGDLAAEERVLGRVKPVTVLKAAHHGSKYSSSDTFLNMTRPQEVVISVGKNSYGHPHKDVLERIHKVNAKILRTDQEGSIQYECKALENKCSYVGRRWY